MQRDTRAYLSDMRSSAVFVRTITSGRSVEGLKSDRLFRSAIERELMILGEALYQLHDQAPEVAERIAEFRKIINFRHILVHGYHRLDHEVIWGVACEASIP